VTWHAPLIMLALAALHPVLTFSLEYLSLRELTAKACCSAAKRLGRSAASQIYRPEAAQWAGPRLCYRRCIRSCSRYEFLIWSRPRPF
jgi:hypothetical protein